MTEEFEHKIILVLSKMRKTVSRKELKTIVSHGGLNSAFKIFDELGIKYETYKNPQKMCDIRYTLVSDFKESKEMVYNYDDSKFAKMFDFLPVFNEMKKHPINKKNFCSLLGCKNSQYDNVLAYISINFPIYETEDERIGYLI